MEKLPSSGKYSLKNIPIPPEDSLEYEKKMISQMEHFLRRLRWRAIFYLKDIGKWKPNPNNEISSQVDLILDIFETYESFENYGFKSELKPPQVSELAEFENLC